MLLFFWHRDFILLKEKYLEYLLNNNQFNPQNLTMTKYFMYENQKQQGVLINITAVNYKSCKQKRGAWYLFSADLSVKSLNLITTV